MESPLNVVILAAGHGKRMHSALPKVLHRLGGKLLLQHVADTAALLQPARICVVYGHGGSAVPDALKESAISWVKQEPQLGTGHAVMQALPQMDRTGVTLILYADVPLTRPATLRALAAIAHSGDVALLTIQLEDATGYGRILRDASGAILGIVEEKDASPEQLAGHEVNTGIMALATRRLAGWLEQLDNRNAQGEYYLTDIIAMAVADGVQVRSLSPSHRWEGAGVNTRQQLAEMERFYQGERAAALLAQGVTLVDPGRFDVRGELRCGRDVEIDVNCVFEGNISLGDNVSIGANCILRDVTVGPFTRILPFSLIEDALIGEQCRIGPYARIRPGTVVSGQAHIGNFVEVKNSEIGERSKANHLAYIGDTSVGRDVNIGAGTITCNYDGANKHRTVIEDDVFIGSDSQLVAPVRLGRGSTIGAGATITRDTPPEQLTLSRVAQVSVPGWKRPKKK
jgi:bifunctional UDP-N-acetylglucosamine pyrophosphorylase / glucosamine-1-phosphate N-acetyltransferase